MQDSSAENMAAHETPINELNLKHQMDEMVELLLHAEIDLRLAKRELERAYLTRVMTLCHGSIGKASQQLGVHRNTLSKKIRDLQVPVHAAP